ncbi:hypothetical protein [Aquicoccus porphyridii]|nr:hypothetical protein [Aquicoccus porphyridii]
MDFRDRVAQILRHRLQSIDDATLIGNSRLLKRAKLGVDKS